MEGNNSWTGEQNGLYMSKPVGPLSQIRDKQMRKEREATWRAQSLSNSAHIERLGCTGGDEIRPYLIFVSFVTDVTVSSSFKTSTNHHITPCSSSLFILQGQTNSSIFSTSAHMANHQRLAFALPQLTQRHSSQIEY